MNKRLNDAFTKLPACTNTLPAPPERKSGVLLSTVGDTNSGHASPGWHFSTQLRAMRFFEPAQTRWKLTGLLLNPSGPVVNTLNRSNRLLAAQRRSAPRRAVASVTVGQKLRVCGSRLRPAMTDGLRVKRSVYRRHAYGACTLIESHHAYAVSG